MLYVSYLVLFWSLFAQPATAPRADALILEVSGNWKLGHKPAEVGMGLSLGQTLRIDTGKMAGKLVILYRNGEKRSCPDKDRPVCLDITVESFSRKPTSVWERVFAALADAFDSDSRSVPGLTKSASIADGYGVLSHGSLTIHSPDMPLQSSEHAYSLQFRRFTSENALAPPLESSYQWHPGSPFDAKSVKPGLYRVNLLDKISRPSGDFFLLLVFEEDRGGPTAEDFETLVTSTRDWGANEQTTGLTARRLYLWQSAKAMGFKEVR